MTTGVIGQTSVSDALHRILFSPTGGIVGLVDGLLAVSQRHDLMLTWEANSCRVHVSGADGGEWIDVPLRKSVFRAILARVAVICNEQVPDAVSPYGGRGELAVGTNPIGVIRVSFENTPEVQTLELTMSGRAEVVDSEEVAKALISLGTHPVFISIAASGYVLTYRRSNDPDGAASDLIVTVTHNGCEVATADFCDDGFTAHCNKVDVKEDHRRRSLATAMYLLAECVLAKSLLNYWGGGDGQKEAAKLMWANPNRLFGHRIKNDRT